MSTLKVNNIVNKGSPVNFPYDINVSNTGKVEREYYEQTTEPTSAGAGAIWHNTDTSDTKIYLNNGWYTINKILPPPPFVGSRGVFGGGMDAIGIVNIIHYVTIPTPGNASDFGDLNNAVRGVASCSNGSRGLFAGGYDGSVAINVIDYITIGTLGNATDFGNLTRITNGGSALSDGTYGVHAGGTYDNFGPTAWSAQIQYVTISTLGNAINFGNLTLSRGNQGACASETRGLYAGGSDPQGWPKSNIDYITIATPGNATNFGNLTSDWSGPSGCSNGYLGLFSGGYNSGTYSGIEYVTISTDGNAQTFGNLTENRTSTASCSDGTYAVIAGGARFGTYWESNTIDYVTINTLGDATDFGDLTVAIGSYWSACSGE